MEIYFIVIFVLLGMVVASFLNVCADRLPAGQSVVFPPSHCPACRKRLAARDLVPVFSYLWLRGRCRYCGASIPRRVLWVEIGTGALFGLVCWRFGLGVELAVALAYCCLFIVLLVIDLEHKLILNRVVYPALIFALLLSAFCSLFFPLPEIVPSVTRAAIGGAAAFAVFFLIAIVSRGGMGWGDVKMAALVGLVAGFPLMVLTLLLGMILGGITGVALIALKLRGRRDAIPFGPFLSVAAVVTLLWGNNIYTWWLG